MSDYFIESNYNIDKNDVTTIKSGELEDGSQEEYERFFEFAESYAQKDFKNSENYKVVCDFIDIDSMIEHYAAGLYLGTYDWPNYNYGVWKTTGEQIEGNQYSDGKWRFISYDFDYTMGATYEDFGSVEPYNYNSFQYMQKNSKYSPTNLFVKLLENDEFKAKFAAVYCDYANEVFSMENVNRMIEHYRTNYIDLLANTQYLSDIPVTITAIPDENQVFAGWGGAVESKEPTITVKLSQAMSITATFEEGGKFAGDINSDGKINASDIILLQKYLCGITGTIDNEASDMNSDGKINIADLCLIKEAVIG